MFDTVGMGARPAADQVTNAGGVQGRSDLESIIGDTAPVGMDAALLPLSDTTAHMLPGGGLRRGSTIVVSGEQGVTTVSMALAAGPCRAGAWMGCTGFPELGWDAASEVGLALERVVSVDLHGSDRDVAGVSRIRGTDRKGGGSWTKVLAAMVDAFDVVVCGPAVSMDSRLSDRLRSRARERGTVVLRMAPGLDRRGFSCDVEIKVTGFHWEGLGMGWGGLRGRSITVEVGGKGSLARNRVCEVSLGLRECA